MFIPAYINTNNGLFTKKEIRIEKSVQIKLRDHYYIFLILIFISFKPYMHFSRKNMSLDTCLVFYLLYSYS